MLVELIATQLTYLIAIISAVVLVVFGLGVWPATGWVGTRQGCPFSGTCVTRMTDGLRIR